MQAGYNRKIVMTLIGKGQCLDISSGFLSAMKDAGHIAPPTLNSLQTREKTTSIIKESQGRAIESQGRAMESRYERLPLVCW